MSETVFDQVNYSLGALMDNIELGAIGLPDIQRPFIWNNSKVRDLFDSMYRGYPVGYLLFWKNAYRDGVKNIGADAKQKVANLLIVDGQQRLTSLYAVIKGIPVVRENYDSEAIEIALNPLKQTFEVADAAIRRDKTYIPNISRLWSSDTDMFEVVDGYLGAFQGEEALSSEEQKAVKSAISRLHGLLSYPFTALELSAQISEEQVSEVFVRVNSKGIPLNQADFILTLMSVFWDQGRTELEKFCAGARTPGSEKASPYNHYIHPDPDQLLRVDVGLGFKRARLNYVYSILRGKDLETGEFSAERRDRQLDTLKQAQSRVLNLQHWHDFFHAIRQAGFRSRRMISSRNSLIFSYVLYLIGKTEYRVEEHELRQTIARWFFMSSLTGRYTSSPESTLEFDLARLRDVKSPERFVEILGQVCDNSLTGDFWSITLPGDLATSSPTSPSLFAYYAALVLLEARVLYSKQEVSDLLDASIKPKRAAIERHHLFPKSYLKKAGVTEIRDTNQIANFALIEWGDNASISDTAPAKYVPKLASRFKNAEVTPMRYWHALPEGWEEMPYSDFLARRREMIAGVIKDGYERLKEGATEDFVEPTLEELLVNGESTELEFKSALRVNLHTGQPDPRIELSCLKTMAGFLNTKGGTLIVGVADDGQPLGVQMDGFKNEDRMNLHLVSIVKDRIGSHFMGNVHPRFEDYRGVRVMAVECWPSKTPAFVKDGQAERFYIRAGASTAELTAKQAHQYIQQRFGVHA